MILVAINAMSAFSRGCLSDATRISFWDSGGGFKLFKLKSDESIAQLVTVIGDRKQTESHKSS